MSPLSVSSFWLWQTGVFSPGAARRDHHLTEDPNGLGAVWRPMQAAVKRWDWGQLGRRAGSDSVSPGDGQHCQPGISSPPPAWATALEDGDWWAGARPEQQLIKKIKRSDGSQLAWPGTVHHGLASHPPLPPSVPAPVPMLIPELIAWLKFPITFFPSQFPDKNGMC